MMCIELKDIRIYANHGLHRGESITGNTYNINLIVKYEEGNKIFYELQSTVNYEKLYEIVKQRMQVPTPLLETVCDEIIKQIKFDFTFITEVMISIYKIQAPIENFEGQVGVTLHKIFNG